MKETHFAQYTFFFFSHSLYVEEKLGTKYIKKRTIPFETSYEETGPGTPVFFVLSPGVDPLKDVEAVGKKLDFTLTKGNLHNVSLGQVRGISSIDNTTHCSIILIIGSRSGC